jgi:large subunit ribosomal protein L24
MAMKKIKKDDNVVVLTGKDRGRTGRVIKYVKGGDCVLVEGVRLVKKHIKPNPQKNIQGGIVTKEAGIHISNIALLNPTTKKPDRVGFKILEDGKKVRYFKSNNEIIDV